MKVIAFILSAYLIFLFAIPCCSFDNCPDEKTAQTQEHEEGDGDCGSCSPFFTCTGCSGITASAENSEIEVAIMLLPHQYAGFILSSIQEIHYDFWQPPKLV